MARPTVNVTHDVRSSSRIPDWCVHSVLLLRHLDVAGNLEQVRDLLRIQRQGGYAGYDLFVFLFVFLASGLKMGIRPFWGAVDPWKRQVAAIAECRTLPSPASVSRALQKVSPELVRDLALPLLVENTGVLEVMKHPSAQMLDAQGRAWHVFHKDGTRQVLRQRSLPRATDELPAAQRRATEAQPGYPGRKRGEVQAHRAVLQHGGSSAWLMSDVSPGNGRRYEDLHHALHTLVRTMAMLEHPLERAVLCMDGEDGWVPSFHRCMQQDVHFATRLNRAELLDLPQIRQAMRKPNWYHVPDSGSGPQRLALDLGIITIQPGEATRDEAGERYPPVDVRVVVSRFQQPDRDRGAGRKIDGTHYELFATTLDAASWPAAEVVRLYYARNAQENRFLQEDRSLGLDRVFSYHLPGQALVTLVGLMLWNLELAMGFKANPPTDKDLPVATPTELEPASAPCEIPVLVPPSESLTDDGVSAVLAEIEAAERDLHRQVDALGIEQRLPAGWVWHHEHGLTCPDGRSMTLSGLTRGSSPGLIFRRPRAGCTDCPLRKTCLASANTNKVKERRVTLPRGTEALPALRQALMKQQAQRRLARSHRALQRTAHQRQNPDPFQIQGGTPAAPKQRGCVPSTLLPARARHHARNTTRHTEVHIRVTEPRRTVRSHPYIAASDAKRQHRRLTWTQRLEYNSLRPTATIDLTIGHLPQQDDRRKAV